MDEKQLQFLYSEYAKNKGFKDYSEFKGLMSSEESRKLFFDDSNKELGFKDYNEFNDLLGLKKKDQVSPSVSFSTKSQSVLPDFEKGRAFAEKGFLMQGEGTKTPKPEKRISFEPSFNIAAPFEVKVLEEGEEPSLAADLMIAGARGQIQGKVANLLPAGKVPTNEELGEIAQLQTDAKLLPQSKAEKAYQEKGLKGLFSESPLLGAQFVGETMLSSLASLAQASSRTLPTAIAAGAGAGAAFGGIGALPGAAMGMLAGQSAAGYNLSTSQDILNSLSENGVDISNKESLINAFADENKMAKIRTTAAKYGVPILLFDAATAGLAGKLATGAMGKSLSRKLLAGLGEAGIQMTGGAGGELAGQIASGKKVNWDDVAVEAIAEVPGGAVEVATGIALERSKASSNNNTLATQIATQGPEDGTKDAVLNLNRDLANNVITPEQHQEGMDFVEKAVQVSSKIPETVTGESKAKSIELLVERNNIKENNQILEQQKQSSDEAYHAGIDEEIKANEEKIKKIDSEVYNIAKNPIPVKEKSVVQISEPTEEIPVVEEYDLKNGDIITANIGGKKEKGRVTGVGRNKGEIVIDFIDENNNERFVYGNQIENIEKGQAEIDNLSKAQKERKAELLNKEELTQDDLAELDKLNKEKVEVKQIEPTKEVKPTEEDIKSFVDKWEGFDLLNKADEDFYNKNEKAIEKEISDRKEKRKPKPILDESGNFKANWNYEGEGDLLSGYTGKKAYVERMLGDNYIRAKQQNKLNTEEPLSYGLYEGKDGVLAMDANYNTIGRLDINNKGGIEHIVVAPEFERKGVAQKMIKELQKAGIKINFEKSERISPDAAKLFNKIAKSEVKPTEVKVSEEVKAAEGFPEGIKEENGELKGNLKDIIFIDTKKLKPLNEDEEMIAWNNKNKAKKENNWTDKEWAESILDMPTEEDPIDAVLKRNGEIVVTDGHHRLLAAKILGKDLAVNLKVEGYVNEEGEPNISEYLSELSSRKPTLEAEEVNPTEVEETANALKSFDKIIKGTKTAGTEVYHKAIDLINEKKTHKFTGKGWEDVAEAYHKALKNGKNPELVELIDKTLVKENAKVEKPTEVKTKEEAPKKTYQEALKEKQEAEKKRNREVGAEKAAITKELKKEANKIEISDARSAALNYLSGANLSEEAINEVSGRVKRARLNTGEREFKSEEARARDYVAKKGEGESLDAAAHSIWDNLSDEMQSKMDTQEVKEALMQAIMENKTKAEALKSLIDGYKEESLEDQEAEFYRRYNITEDEIEAELALAEESLELDGSDEYDFDLPEEHINNLIEQYEAEAKNKIEQPAEGGKEKGAEKISAREVSESEAKLVDEYREAVKKAGKKARENAKNEFVNRNFNLIKEKLKIEIKCPT